MAKKLLGVVHLRPLPSAARGGEPFEGLLESALRDATALAEGGVDGLIVENFGDAPFRAGTRADPVPPDVTAALAVVAREVRRETGLAVGVNCLRNDGMSALGAAVVAGASWIRVNVLSGTAVTDQGRIDGEAARILAYRRLLGAEISVLADLWVKHAVPLAPPPLQVAARDLALRSGADGLIVSGHRTGEAPDTAFLRDVRQAVGEFPVWIGSGLTPENAGELWPHCDGAIVGTALKRDGHVDAPVDVERVRRMRGAVSAG